MSDPIIGGAISGVGSLLGAGINAIQQNKINKENAKLQREFAQNSIQWKVADAKKAGIHPLVAMGASGYSAQPSYVGANIGEGIAGFAKNIGGAIQADARQSIKDNAELRELQIEEARLNNELLKKKIRGDNDTVSPLFKGTFTPTNPNHLLSQNADARNGANTTAPKLSDAVTDTLKKMEAPFTISSRGNGTYDLSFDPNGLQGQSFSEGTTGKVMAYMSLDDWLFDDDAKNLKELEKVAKQQGILTKNKPYFDVDYTTSGFKLVPSASPNLYRFKEFSKSLDDRFFKWAEEKGKPFINKVRRFYKSNFK